MKLILSVENDFRAVKLLLKRRKEIKSEFVALKRILNVENGFEGVLEVHFTKFAISDFVSRHNAVFSARTIFRGDLEV